jgi:hypothetical protein
MEAQLIEALNRIAAALERLADAYLYCNSPEPEGEPTGPAMSGKGEIIRRG